MPRIPERYQSPNIHFRAGGLCLIDATRDRLVIKVKWIVVASLIAALLVSAATIYVLSAGYSTDGGYTTPVAGLHTEVLGDGSMIRYTIMGVSLSDIDFSYCKISVHTPTGQSDVLNLTNIVWIGNDSAIYTLPNGYKVTLNRTSVHDHLSSGDRIELSSLGGKLATGTWSMAIIDPRTGGAIASAQQVID
jgi:FlaG/FlaF family flagellin (archaellin)